MIELKENGKIFNKKEVHERSFALEGNPSPS
jgi:hypothetical protein